MKRFIVTAFCTLFVFMSVLSVGAVANAATNKTAESGIISIDNVTVGAGDSFKLPIVFKKNPGIFGMTIVLGYDKDNITYNNVSYDEQVFSKGELIVNSENAGQVIIQIMSNDINKDNAKTGKLVTLDFKARGDAVNGTYNLTLGKYSSDKNDGAACNVSEQTVEFSYVSASVKISGGLASKPATTAPVYTRTEKNGEAVTGSDGKVITYASELEANAADISAATTAKSSDSDGKEIGGTVSNNANSNAGENNYNYTGWIILAILIAIAVVCIIVLMAQRKKNRAEETAKPIQPQKNISDSAKKSASEEKAKKTDDTKSDE